MALTKEDLKNSMRIDSDEEGVLERYLIAAEIAIKNPIGATKEFYEREDVESLFEVAVLALAGTFYEQRTSQSATQTYEINSVSKSIVGVLQAKYMVFLAGDSDG